jgi:hypothetical protein
MDVETGDLLVARLWRWDADRLRQDAERDHRERLAAGEAEPDYSVSVFAKPKIGGQAVEDLMHELCEHILQVPRSANWVTFSTGTRLLKAGFPLRLSEPPPHHYDVVLGTDLELADVKGLAEVLGEQDKRRFPACTA